MTVLAHAAQAYMISKSVGLSEELSIASAIVATYPDSLTYLDQRRKDFAFYNRFHDVTNFIMMILAWPAWLHSFVDIFMHDRFGQWFRWTYYIEAAWWLFFITVQFKLL